MEEITLQELKDILKEKVRKDLLMYGIVTGICAVLMIFALIMTGTEEILDIGVSKAELVVGIILAPFLMAFIPVGIGVGFKFLYLVFENRLNTNSLLKRMLIGLFIMFFGQIIGMILFPVRVIYNTVMLIIVSKKISNNISE